MDDDAPPPLDLGPSHYEVKIIEDDDLAHHAARLGRLYRDGWEPVEGTFCLLTTGRWCIEVRRPCTEEARRLQVVRRREEAIELVEDVAAR